MIANNLHSMPEVIAPITQLVSQKLPEWFGEGTVMLAFDGRVERRSFSNLIRYHVTQPDGTNLTLIAKLAQTTDACHYCHILTKIANVFADKSAHYCYIRPLDCLSEYNAIIMEELPSHSLRDEFVHPNMMVGLPKSRQQFLTYLVSAGSWLRIYHDQASGVIVEHLTKADLEALANEKINTFHAFTKHSVNTNVIEQRLAYWLDRITDIYIPYAHLHKDYSYANILITSDGRVGSLDAKHRYGAIYEDLAHLMIDGYTGKWQLLSCGQIFRQHYLLQCQNAILQGYFAAAPVDHDLLNFYCTLAVLNKWIYIEKYKLKQTLIKSRIFATTFRRYLHRLSLHFIALP